MKDSMPEVNPSTLHLLYMVLSRYPVCKYHVNRSVISFVHGTCPDLYFVANPPVGLGSV